MQKSTAQSSILRTDVLSSQHNAFPLHSKRMSKVLNQAGFAYASLEIQAANDSHTDSSNHKYPDI
jgi:hypothetical protein